MQARKATEHPNGMITAGWPGDETAGGQAGDLVVLRPAGRFGTTASGSTARPHAFKAGTSSSSAAPALTGWRGDDALAAQSSSLARSITDPGHPQVGMFQPTSGRGGQQMPPSTDRSQSMIDQQPLSPSLIAEVGFEIEIAGAKAPRVSKSARLAEGSGWRLETDSRVDDVHDDLEFIVQPVNSSTAVEAVIKDISSVVQRMRERALGGNGRAFMLSEALGGTSGVLASGDVPVLVDDVRFAARIQVTYGIGLTGIPSAVDRLYSKFQADEIHEATRAVESAYSKRYSVPLSAASRGFVELLNIYLLAAARAPLPIDPVTVKTVFRMMARSDFSSIYEKLLGDFDREQMRQLILPDHADGVPLFMEARSMPKGTTVFVNPYNISQWPPTLVSSSELPHTEEWMRSIIHGRGEGVLRKDLLSPPPGYSLHSGDLGSDYSMGAMGVDAVNGLVLFEIRGAAHRPEVVTPNGQLLEIAVKEYSDAAAYNPSLQRVRTPAMPLSARFGLLATLGEAYEATRDVLRYTVKNDDELHEDWENLQAGPVSEAEHAINKAFKSAPVDGTETARLGLARVAGSLQTLGAAYDSGQPVNVIRARMRELDEAIATFERLLWEAGEYSLPTYGPAEAQSAAEQGWGASGSVARSIIDPANPQVGMFQPASGHSGQPMPTIPPRPSASERVINAAEQLVGTLQWRGGSGPDPRDNWRAAGITTFGNPNDFARWIRGEGPRPSRWSTMTCSEAILFSAYRAGVLSETELTRMYALAAEAAQDAFAEYGSWGQSGRPVMPSLDDGYGEELPVTTWAYNQVLMRHLISGELRRYQVGLGGTGIPNIPAGHIVFFDGFVGHVALSLGTRDDQGRQQILSHPGRPGHTSDMQVTSVEELLASAEMAATVVEFAAPSWAAPTTVQAVGGQNWGASGSAAGPMIDPTTPHVGRRLPAGTLASESPTAQVMAPMAPAHRAAWVKERTAPRPGPIAGGNITVQTLKDKTVTAVAEADRQLARTAKRFRWGPLPNGLQETCLAQMRALADELFPLGIGSRAPLDDAALPADPVTRRWLERPQDWTWIADWQALIDQVVDLKAGGAAFVVQGRPGAIGHAFALVNTIEGIHTADPQAGGVFPTSPAALGAPFEVRALLIKPNGQATLPPGSAAQETRPQVDIDPDGTRWASSNRSALDESGKAIPKEQRSCVEITVIRPAEGG